MSVKTDDITVLIVVIGAVFVFLLIYALTLFFADFIKELKYINCEIQRTRGGERKYWKRQRRRLWLSLIPFVKY